MLTAMTGAPAVVRNEQLDILAANPLGRALYAELFEDPDHLPNHARYAFLDERSRDFWVDWKRAADDTVGILRVLAGRDPYDKGLTTLIGELSTRSDEFRTRWARHDVHLHRGGAKKINHPVVGRLDLMYDTLPIAQAPGLTMLVYTAEPGTPTADAIAMLASWAATQARRPTPPTRRFRHAHPHPRTGPAGLGHRPRRDGDEPELRPQPGHAATT